MSQEMERDLNQAQKRAGQTARTSAKVAKKGAKAGVKASKVAFRVGKFILKRVILTKVGLPIIGGLLLILLILSPLISIFDAVSSGDLDGNGQIGGANKALQAIYQKVAERANPNIQSQNSEELNYLLKWGMVYAVDMLSHEAGADPIKATHLPNRPHINGNQSDLPYNDINQLAQLLAPRFAYRNSTVTVTTITQIKVKVKDPRSGQVRLVTKTEKKTKEEKVKLLTRADTLQGIYDYSYKSQTKKSQSGMTRITVKNEVVSNVIFQKDDSRLDSVIKDYLHVDKVSQDDRDLVMEVARTAGVGESDLGYLIGESGAGPPSISDDDLSRLPKEWKQAFQQAGKTYKVNPSILMAIAFVESSFNPNAVGPPNPSGELAEGMMQFLPSTWDTFGVDGDTDGKTDIFDPIDAIYTAARYLSYLHIETDPHQALYRYSGGSYAYAKKVIHLSQTIGESGGNGQLAWPVPTSTRITSPFATRINPINGQLEKHNGIDIGAPCGTPIVASAKGRVLSSGPASGYGQWIVLDHGGGLTTIYGHMYAQDRLVNVGEQVQRGQLIAYVGANGQATGCHLHFQVEQNGIPVNPESYLKVSF